MRQRRRGPDLGQALVEAAEKAKQALEQHRTAQETRDNEPNALNTLQTKRPVLSLKR